jgi:hypothetical protein
MLFTSLLLLSTFFCVAAVIAFAWSSPLLLLQYVYSASDDRCVPSVPSVTVTPAVPRVPAVDGNIAFCVPVMYNVAGIPAFVCVTVVAGIERYCCIPAIVGRIPAIVAGIHAIVGSIPAITGSIRAFAGFLALAGVPVVATGC